MFLSPEVALYLYKSTICPCMEYCCHVWAVAPSCYLDFLDKLQKQICRIVGPSLVGPTHNRKWSELICFINNTWSSARVSSRTTSVFNLYQWPEWCGFKHWTVHHFANDANLLYSNFSLKSINKCTNHDLRLIVVHWLQETT